MQASPSHPPTTPCRLFYTQALTKAFVSSLSACTHALDIIRSLLTFHQQQKLKLTSNMAAWLMCRRKKNEANQGSTQGNKTPA
ncbi:hypothetical protein C0Q70_18970 [Pomacea canaliculata]|uniref:Uncharacterized protein n=1 Tax=Pomacea canaliculata TaxID=400727 RepID=A0A2T7NI08_POMCA|nr:hypothetical protein C0Q70_18970 [Pomacea canaliculata]